MIFEVAHVDPCRPCAALDVHGPRPNRLSRAGKRVRLVDSPFEQPLGRRSTAQVWPVSWRIVAAFPVRDAMMLGLWLLGWTSGTTVWRGNTLPLAAKGGMADGRAEAAGST